MLSVKVEQYRAITMALATDTAVDEAIRARIYAMPLDKIVGQLTTATVKHLKDQIAKIAALIKTNKMGQQTHASSTCPQQQGVPNCFEPWHHTPRPHGQQQGPPAATSTYPHWSNH